MRVSLLTKVTRVPRGTVMFWGQTELFDIVIVVDVELAVQVDDGEVLLFELPPHATAAKAVSAAPAM